MEKVPHGKRCWLKKTGTGRVRERDLRKNEKQVGWCESLHKVNGLTGTKCNHTFCAIWKWSKHCCRCCCCWEQCYCYFFENIPFRSHEIRNRDKSIKINRTFSSIKAENTGKNFRILLSMCIMLPSLLAIPLFPHRGRSIFLFFVFSAVWPIIYCLPMCVYVCVQNCIDVVDEQNNCTFNVLHCIE